ncbi:hypothetical protein LCGC14_1054600 [marine sediment metagenome]|uniref:MYM-type domain-containing protein n=1 Tax=marine sediment metagenome TaxID=412755 RepID=A0A0F9QTV4_9ZZZZ
MCLFRPTSSVNFVAQCEICKAQTNELSNNSLVAIYVLMDMYGWIIYDDQKTTFCSEKCLDEYEIENIDERLN